MPLPSLPLSDLPSLLNNRDRVRCIDLNSRDILSRAEVATDLSNVLNSALSNNLSSVDNKANALLCAQTNDKLEASLNNLMVFKVDPRVSTIVPNPVEEFQPEAPLHLDLL